jgi:hypothetical protein
MQFVNTWQGRAIEPSVVVGGVWDVARRLKAERVVGVTLAASGFGCLDEIGFPLVLLDEACQQTESSSLLALARFGVENLVLVGDPMQVGEMKSPPTPANTWYQSPITFHLSK